MYCKIIKLNLILKRKKEKKNKKSNNKNFDIKFNCLKTRFNIDRNSSSITKFIQK